MKRLESDFQVVMKMVSELREEREDDKRRIGNLEKVKELKTQLERCSKGIRKYEFSGKN